MAIEQRERRTKNYIVMRSIMDIGMGLVIFGFGMFLFLAPQLGIEFNVEPLFRYFFAGMCVIYGGWRMYRGYKKNYIQHDVTDDL